MSLAALVVLFAVAVYAQGSKPLNERIPKANPNLYRAVLDGRDWKNPFLIVHRDGVEIVVSGTQRQGIIPLASVPEALERLPDSAWPFGLVVALADEGVQVVGDGPPIKQNREQLLSLLGKLHIAVELWPSA
jgi:hypothetical protein